MTSAVTRWPELFVGLTAGQRRTVARNLAHKHPDRRGPSRAEVDAMVQYVVGEISQAEYARRCPHPAPVATRRH